MLREFLPLDLVEGSIVEENVNGAQIHVQGERDRILGDGVRVEMHVQSCRAASGRFDESVMTVPEAVVVLGVGGEVPDVLVALARESDHQDHPCVR